MTDSDEITDFRPSPRASEDVVLSIPLDTLASIREIAAARDMSPEALLRFYIGNGLRHDVAVRYSERILEKIERVLERHVPSQDERRAILREIRGDTAA